MIDERWRTVRRVLAVRLDNLGDVLVTTPAIHAIKQSLPALSRGAPGASLTLLASPVGAQVGRLNPDIDDVIVYEAPWMDPWHRLPQDADREQRTIATIKERDFDGAIIFTSFRQSALPAAYLCYLAGIPLRVAASIDGPGSLLTTRHKHPERMMHEEEQALVERICHRLGATAHGSVLSVAGPLLPFSAFCALVEAANLVITNNTGPMHVSAAVKTPVVALFALTNPPEQWGPWRVPHRQLYHDVPCRICYSRICPYGHECLRLVTPRSVVDAAAELVGRRQYAVGRPPVAPPAADNALAATTRRGR